MGTLVTGAFGCLGSWVVRALLARGERPITFDLGDDPWRMRMINSIDGHGPSSMKVADVAERITLVRGDIADFETGMRRTLDDFARLRRDGRLDARELRGDGG
jgi:nucleoside-diphosphate-sugar epimerase